MAAQPAPSRLNAYHGGSGMWSIRSIDGTRAYDVRIGRGDRVTSIRNRRGDAVSPDGPTSQEIKRAIRRSRLAEQQAAAAARGGR